jgi:hypothetical protein
VRSADVAANINRASQYRDLVAVAYFDTHTLIGFRFSGALIESPHADQAAAVMDWIYQKVQPRLLEGAPVVWA